MSLSTTGRLDKWWSKPCTALTARINSNLPLILLYTLVAPIPGYGRGAQDQPKEPLGSLTSVGEVYVNDSQAPRESTTFPGDRIRTEEQGAASFSISGKGTLKIAPQSQVAFSGNYQFTAELQAGSVVLNTVSGANRLTVRVGNYVVVPNGQNQSATLEVALAPNGAVFVNCRAGIAAVLTLEGNVGQLLQAGQSMNVLANSPYSAPVKQAGPGHTGWLLLGLGGAGAAAAIGLLTHGSGGQSISPSAP